MAVPQTLRSAYLSHMIAVAT